MAKRAVLTRVAERSVLYRVAERSVLHRVAVSALTAAGLAVSLAGCAGASPASRPAAKVAVSSSPSATTSSPVPMDRMSPRIHHDRSPDQNDVDRAELISSVSPDTTESPDPKVFGQRLKARHDEGFTWLKMDLGVDLVQNTPGTVTRPAGPVGANVQHMFIFHIRTQLVYVRQHFRAAAGYKRKVHISGFPGKGFFRLIKIRMRIHENKAVSTRCFQGRHNAQQNAAITAQRKCKTVLANNLLNGFAQYS